MRRISDMEMVLLSRVVDDVRNNAGADGRADLRLLSAKHGLDIDKVMEEVISICETRDYNVGCHMYCTRANVIPHYKKDRRILLDKDHAEGLLMILAVHYGRKDY